MKWANHNFKNIARGTSASKRTRGAPDAPQSLPWSQGSFYTCQIVHQLSLVDGVLSKLGSESAKGGPEMTGGFPVQPRHQEHLSE